MAPHTRVSPPTSPVFSTIITDLPCCPAAIAAARPAPPPLTTTTSALSDYQLFSESVLDEMLLGISSKDKKENTQKAKFILNVLGLDKYIDKHPFALSRGEKQRLTIACGMMKIPLQYNH